MKEQPAPRNPLSVRDGFPPFDEISPEHVVPAVRQMLQEVEAILTDVEENGTPTWDGFLKPLEALDLPYEYTWGPISHFMSVKNSPELREAHQTVQPDVVKFGLRFSQSKKIYALLEQLRNGPEWDRLTPARQRVVEMKLKSARHSGIGLEGEKRDRFNANVDALSKLTTDFANHVLDATKSFELIVTDKADIEGWPANLRQVAASSYANAKGKDAPKPDPENGPWRITLDGPSFGPFMQHSRNRAQRETVYRAFITRASSGEFDNSEILEKILRLRKEQAELLGFPCFATASLDRKMAPDIETIDALFGRLEEAAKPHAVKDLDELRAIARKNGQTDDLKHWDLAFWAERLREQTFNYTDEQLRPYFPLPRVLKGLFGLAERLFGIDIREAEGDAPIWDPAVMYFKVFNEAGKQLAGFYLDPYSRPENKRGGAWMNDCFSRRIINGKPRLPLIFLCCNGTPPVGDQPSLMSFGEVNTLFHEFGHGLQGMLTTIDDADVSGLNGIEWDAVEIASQFMENWCYHKPTLIGMTKHVETGEPLPDDLFEKICAARNFRAGSGMIRQLEFSKVDLVLHSEYDPDGPDTALDVDRRISEAMSVFPPHPDSRFLCSFTHIFAGGYAAGYYSYKWAEVLSADAFGAFEEAGLDNEDAVKTIGRRFRDTFLALGGSKHPMEVFKDFRGRDPSPEALLRQTGLDQPVP